MSWQKEGILDGLDGLERHVYALCFQSIWTPEEAAQILGISTIQSLDVMATAKQKLRDAEQHARILDMIDKTISQQAAKKLTYEILKKQGLPIPPDLEEECGDE